MYRYNEDQIGTTRKGKKVTYIKKGMRNSRILSQSKANIRKQERDDRQQEEHHVYLVLQNKTELRTTVNILSFIQQNRIQLQK